MLHKNILTRFLRLTDFSSFACPACKTHLAVPDERKLVSYQSQASINSQEDEDSSPEWNRGTFSVSLKCSNPLCNQVTICTGEYDTEEADVEEFGPQYYKVFKPKFFLPAIEIFAIPHNLPEQIMSPLLESFSIYWVNPSASGNSLRISLEALMDFKRVKKTAANSQGNRRDISLHGRIEEFKRMNASKQANVALAEELLAIKWIGNGGSHLAGLTDGNMVEAYKLMEHVLDELFNQTSVRREKLTRIINKTKKPV